VRGSRASGKPSGAANSSTSKRVDIVEAATAFKSRRRSVSSTIVAAATNVSLNGLAAARQLR
jgi:hypothetical protein